MFYQILVCYYSNFDGDANTLELGQEVEYTLGVRGSSGSCRSAENVKVYFHDIKSLLWEILADFV